MSMSIILNRQAMEAERLAAEAQVQLPVRAEAPPRSKTWKSGTTGWW